jgi:ribosomal protein S18 acetylase RimI-like enzyme
MLTIRQYQLTDRADVRTLHDLALESVGAHMGRGPWDADLDRIEKEYLENGGEFLIGNLNEKIVAMGALKKTDLNRVEIKRMRVHPDFHRLGFGQLILSALENRAKELGYTQLHLDTTVQQVAAQGLYEKNGYLRSGSKQIGKFSVIVYEKDMND